MQRRRCGLTALLRRDAPGPGTAPRHLLRYKRNEAGTK